MGKINVLDKSIFNLIAAGEVVEKPASVVKELVENSIDAGATQISIDVQNGGISRIRVTDNGCGIEKDDLTKAFLPHATSKIKTANDLYKIGTLGFRGEALSSISAVSKVTMMSKTKDGDGNKIIIEGGEVKEISPVGCMDGTSTTVSDLFYNIPARAKYLRKERQEESDITNYIARLILANPKIAIKYTANDKVVYQSSGTGLYDAMYTIYGKMIVDNITEFDYSDDTYHIYGYIGNPTFSKPNRTYQTFIVNGRYVNSPSLSVAIFKSYENFIMKGTFPFFVLNIDVPLDKVDVNVHPSKLEVKFEDNNHIFGIMYSAISTKLYDIHAINAVGFSERDLKEDVSPKMVTTLPANEGSSFRPVVVEPPAQDVQKDTEPTTTEVKNNDENDANEIKEVNLSSDNMFRENFQTISKLLVSDSPETKVANNDLAYTLAEQLTMKQREVMPKVENTPALSLDIDDYRIVGTLFNTFIIVEQKDLMYIIDQHAAHERLLFDKFTAEYDRSIISTQPLLIPYVLDVNPQEKLFLMENTNELKKLGFDIEPFGENTFKINSVPNTLKNINIQGFFNDVLSGVANRFVVKKIDIMHDYLAKCACRAAVKANDILFDEEIKVLLTNISGKDQVLLCPHGRPIILKVTKTDIEKWFKRLV